jgi:hypothetical protein
MTTRLAFTIPGKIATDHRGHKFFNMKTKRMHAFPAKDYKEFRQRVHLYANVARRDAGWETPAPGTKIKMYVMFHVAAEAIVAFKKPFDKKGRPLKPYRRQRNVFDYGNAVKCLEDSLQTEYGKGKGKLRPILWLGLYHNDRDVSCYPFPGKEWMQAHPGIDEWIEIELVMEDQPGNLFNQPSKAGGATCATVGSVGQEVAMTQTFTTKNHHGRVALSCPFHGAGMNHNLIVE